MKSAKPACKTSGDGGSGGVCVCVGVGGVGVDGDGDCSGSGDAVLGERVSPTAKTAIARTVRTGSISSRQQASESKRSCFMCLQGCFIQKRNNSVDNDAGCYQFARNSKDLLTNGGDLLAISSNTPLPTIGSPALTVGFSATTQNSDAASALGNGYLLLGDEQRVDKPVRSESVIRSAMLIQKWYRRYQSRIEMRKLTAWNIYQTIEYSGEQDQLKLYDFFLTLIKNSNYIHSTMNSVGGDGNKLARPPAIPNEVLANVVRKHSIYSMTSGMSDSSLGNDSGSEPTPEQAFEANTKLINKVFESGKRDKELSKSELKKKTAEITVESSYKGVELTFPIRKKTFHDLVNSFKDNKVLHAKYVIQLLQETIKALRKLKNINFISTSLSNHITIVGDLHGQLNDMMLIFYKNGLPSDENPYLFNGDFVDRGPKSVEVSLLIFCGFLMSPTAVYINRGNHEDHVMNVRYGFLKEICEKYSSHSKKINYLYNEVFSCLPLASLIDSTTYVVHGGVSDRTLLKDILKIKREKYVSILKPPILNDDGELISNLSTHELFEWRQVLDALWSDPKQTLGVEANSFRGGGCLFGSDITDKVMEKNSLSLIIRSHECKESGYEYSHNNKVLTIFSASNYYEYGSNNGAYVRILPNVKPIIVQFHIKEGKEITKNLTIRERVNAIEVSAIKHLLQKFIANKMRLLQEYKAKDTEGTGALSLNDWCQITGDVLELKLPWRTLRHRLVKLNPEGLVLYNSTFEGLSMPQINQSTRDESIAESLYRHKDILESIFRSIDKDHSGQISKDEFRECCRLINHHDMTAKFNDKAIEDMANTMDINKDGHINLNEFLEAFRLVSSRI